MRDTITIKVEAVVKDGVARLYDINGVCITAVLVDRLIHPWRKWAGEAHKQFGIHGKYAHCKQRLLGSAWERRIDGMRHAWKDRIKYMPKEQNNRSVFKGASSWNESMDLLSTMMQSRRHTYWARQRNPWLKWADTKTRTANKRAISKYDSN